MAPTVAPVTGSQLSDPSHGRSSFPLLIVSQVPQPIHAVLACFKLEASDAKPPETAEPASSHSEVYFVRQTVPNACGRHSPTLAPRYLALDCSQLRQCHTHFQPARPYLTRTSPNLTCTRLTSDFSRTSHHNVFATSLAILTPYWLAHFSHLSHTHTHISCCV